MAAIEVRTRGDASRSFRLKWRYGGGRSGAPQSVTYDDLENARRMRGAVEALGHLVYASDPRVVSFELVIGQRPTTYQAPTFGEVAERYISSRTRASAETRKQYRDHVAGRLAALRNRPIEAVTDDEIRQLMIGITDKGGSVTWTYELVCSVFKFAVNKGMLPGGGNPTVFVEAPKKRGRTVNFLTVTETRVLVEKCRTAAHRAVGAALADFVEVLLGTGLRLSEALGLIVADVHVDDVDAAWLDVDQQLGKAVFLRAPVKTAAAQRRVVLDADTARVLARLVAGKRPDAPVFPDPVRGGWWRHWRVEKAWVRVRELAQAGGMAKCPRLHDLRHTHAGWLLTDGVPLLAVSRRLGHESITVTADVYGHLLPEADDTIRRAVAGRRAAMAGSKHTPATAPGRRPARRKPSARPATRKRTPERTTSRKPRSTGGATPATTT